jgi:formylglycine-generating enzyme required for sulfatase activity
LLLSLGEYSEKDLSPDTRQALLPKLLDIYRTASDSGLHAAAEWLLRTWQQGAWLQEVNDEWARDQRQREKRLENIRQLLTKDKEKTPPQWYVNKQGQTMVVIPGPVEFLMGSPSTEEGRSPNELQHRKRISQTYALAARSVTVREFRQFVKENKLEAWFKADGEAASLMKKYSPDEDGPIILVDWYKAAAYCNWMSQQEGIPEDQWCYETDAEQVSQGKVSGLVSLLAPQHPLARAVNARRFSLLLDGKPGVTALKKGYLGLRGYRLPTEAEWECACRAGAVTSWHYGETEELLPRYGWYVANTKGERTWPVGRKKPNDLGLFDMHGNVFTWCQERYQDYAVAKGEGASEDKEDDLRVDSKESRVLRGGSFFDLAVLARCADRNWTVPSYRNFYVGFRPARTFPP